MTRLEQIYRKRVALPSAAVGGTVGIMTYLHHPSAAAATAAVPPKPKVAPSPLFATLANVTVSIPPESGAAATSYVEFSVQLSTQDQTALVTFEELQPIIKAAIMTLLMNETSASLQDPQTRVDLTKGCLHIVNDVLNRNASDMPRSPFSAAYITNLVVQD
ncbi:MAG: flagellar basal body-associated FliL family protein [Proteobacteria bacterium]|nr:flagellar basal body-associated FliL family protein [Pseudomonadota bacterium]